jgi:hypothetical protein
MPEGEVRRSMNDNKIRFWSWVLFGVLAVAIVGVVNWTLVRASAQYDLTQDGRYTIPPALARIAKNFDPKDPEARLKITVYLSESLPRYISHLTRTIRTRLDEVRRASGDKIEYEFVDPKDNTDLMTELNEKFKIAPIALQDFREGELTQGSYYLAMLFRYKKEADPLHLRDIGQDLVKEERTLAVLPGLIATKILKVTTPDEIVVGIVSDKKQPPPQQGQQQAKATDGLDPLRERLKAHCHVKDVTLKGGVPVPPDIKALIVYKPDALAPADVFQLDQFLMRGGRVILLVDTYSAFDYDRISAINQGLQQEKFTLRPIETGLKDWLAFYGMNLQPGVVMDRFNHKLVRIQQVPGTPIPKQELADMPGLLNVRELDADKKPTDQLNPNEMTLAGIGALAFLLPTPMQVNQDEFRAHNPGATLDVLARSSKESWVVKDVVDSVPMYKVTPPPREEWGSSVLVARASGPLRSYWADKEPPAREGAPPAESQPSGANKLTVAQADRPAQIWVVADADFAHEVWQGLFGRNPMDRHSLAAAQGMGISASMVMNMVDVAALGPDLVEIRRQRLTDRSIDDVRVHDDRGNILFYNIALMPLVFVALGLLWWIFRSIQTFVPSPRQPITVPSAAPAPERALDTASVSDKTDSHP